MEGGYARAARARGGAQSPGAPLGSTWGAGAAHRAFPFQKQCGNSQLKAEGKFSVKPGAAFVFSLPEEHTSFILHVIRIWTYLFYICIMAL